MTAKVKQGLGIIGKLVLVSFVVLLAIIGAGWEYYRYTFPYGWSHCCILQFSTPFQLYAEKHQGRLPFGQATAEASLSLLAREDYGIDAYLLRGKTVPLEITTAALAKNGVLGPESCGWHYVEGLTLTDDPEIAVMWDKIGLGHNGERRKDGGHEVLFLGGSRKFISGTEWPGFLERQNQMIAKRTEEAKSGIPALEARIKMPDGRILAHYEGAYTLTEDSGSGHRSESGDETELKWFYLNEQNETITFELTLPAVQLRSKPVTIRIADHSPSTNLIVFEMEKY